MTDKIAEAVKKVKKPKKVSNSRPARWARACSEGQDALAQAVEARDALVEIRKTTEDRMRDQTLPGFDPSTVEAAVEEDKEVIAALCSFEDHLATVNEKLQDLSDLKDEYDGWKGNLPESLQQSPVGEKLEAVNQLNIETDLDIDNFEGAEDTFGECEGADLPKGFGND